MEWLGIILLIIGGVVVLLPMILGTIIGISLQVRDIYIFIKEYFSKKEPENLEKEIEEGDFYLLKDLVEKIKSGDLQYTALDLQLQASYPKRLEWLLNK